MTGWSRVSALLSHQAHRCPEVAGGRPEGHRRCSWLGVAGRCLQGYVRLSATGSVALADVRDMSGTTCEQIAVKSFIY